MFQIQINSNLLKCSNHIYQNAMNTWDSKFPTHTSNTKEIHNTVNVKNIYDNDDYIYLFIHYNVMNSMLCPIKLRMLFLSKFVLTFKKVGGEACCLFAFNSYIITYIYIVLKLDKIWIFIKKVKWLIF
jgi:hypothetical protein